MFRFGHPSASLVAALLLPASASADPIRLKLSFFTSDRSVAYQTAVKPFVDAVNSEGKGCVEIEVYFSGTLGSAAQAAPARARRRRRHRVHRPGPEPGALSATTA